MTQKFIKLTNRTEEFYINPLMIVTVKKEKTTNKATIYTFDGNIIFPSENFDEVMDLIKKSSEFKFEM
jgi:hypothetical protein